MIAERAHTSCFTPLDESAAPAFARGQIVPVQIVSIAGDDVTVRPPACIGIDRVWTVARVCLGTHAELTARFGSCGTGKCGTGFQPVQETQLALFAEGA